uniref:Myb/SANT-like domain-containing protein n=1 Tax=Fagus sylvatica TaxID=28930 RepID=A0A2N9FX33_FAGSY
MYHKVYETRSYNAKEKVKYMAWTSEMDRCLTEILVEEVKKGNKIDSTFKPAAYRAAITALKEKFGLELTKEHVRNRLKTWKKQFGILKELLAHKGFKWDETRKMVIADNSVWNDYSKAHPDAKQFRAKFIENYDELCIIVGNDQTVASSSDNDAEIDVDLTVGKEGVDAGIVSEIQSDDRQTKNLRWTEEMDRCLGKILVEQVRKGHKIDKILQREAYDAAVLDLNERFGPELSKEHIRNRLRTWRKQYLILNELLSHNGFKWDEMQKMIIASDSIWDDYVKTHPDARIFRNRFIQNYDQLYIIFGNYNETREPIPIDASPVQCGGKARDQGKNMRWTYEMDRCLGKVLVEQVILGNKNKLDNKFKPAAYEAAVLAIKKQFHIDLMKDHVRNRLKTWKKQYDILQELLDQSGFEWDGRRKMVIANDSAWNEYLKINPDARTVQGRVINNYEELCVIIGYNDPPESSLNIAENNLDLIVENEAVVAEEAYYNEIDNAKDKGKYISWTDEMDRCLTQLLVEQVMLGNKLEKNFKPVAYMTALTVLNEKFGLDLTRENIRNRLKTWKKQYGLVKELLSHSGFEWDERYKMVVAPDSDWNEYIKRHPDARQLRARSIENYDELRIIVGNEPPGRHWSEAGARLEGNSTFNDEEHVETPAQMFGNEEMSQDNASDGMQGSSHQTRARPSSSSYSKQLLKRRRSSDAMLEMMSAMAADIGRIADALTENNKTVCLDELFEMVQTIPGFDDDLIIEACEYLSFDERRAMMFMKLNERLRKKWLLKRLRGQGN